MPTMNGIDAIKEICAYDPQIKIVVYSGMRQQKRVVGAIDGGAKDFIVKPFDKSRVIKTGGNVVNMG